MDHQDNIENEIDEIQNNYLDDAVIGDEIVKPSHYDINLTLKCEIGTISVSYAQLNSYKIGDVVEFMKWPGKVKLSIHGAYIAEGILVDVEGMLGVKITNKL